ncbi:Uncharacterised protein [Vibrio alginolyticus]|nr:Uncharacterised protein [Vibrio alginolyticus]
MLALPKTTQLTFGQNELDFQSLAHLTKLVKVS